MANIAKRSDGTWRARYRDSGGKEHSRHFARKVDGQRWLDEVTASVVTGQYIDPAAGRALVRDHGERWRAAQVHHRPRTARQVELVLRVHVYPTLGAARLESVGRSDVQALVSAWSATAAPATVRARYAFMRAMFRSAVDDGLIARTPCNRIRLPELVHGQVVPLTVHQVRALVDELPEPYRSVALLGAGCGPRVSEAVGLTVDRVAFLRREVRFDRQLSETQPWELRPVKSRARTVPAPDFVMAALGALAPGRDGFVFARGDGEPVSARMMALAFAAAVRRTPSVPAGTTFHDLRHAYASRLIEGGESVTVVAARLGHSTPTETLRTYAHLWPDSDERTRRIIDRAWSEEDPADLLRTSIEFQAR